MQIDNKKRFIISHILFLLSLVAVYYAPLLSRAAGDTHLPPMTRYVRFYIIGIFSLVFLLYYVFLYCYNKLDISLFKLNSLSIYFWSTTSVIFLFLCTSYPLLSSDLFEYSLRGRMVSLYGLNPYLHTPLDLKQDMFFSFVCWKDAVECCSPAWVLIGMLHTIPFKDSFFLTSFMHKLILLAFLFLNYYFFYRLCILLKLKKADILTAAFVTSPLVIIMTLVDAHNEVVMTFFILASLYFLLQSKYVFSLMLLAVSMQVKFTYMLIAPLFILYILLNAEGGSLRSRIYKLITGGILSAAIIAILWLPFWGKESVLGLYGYFTTYYKKLGIDFWADSIPYAVHFLLTKTGISVSQSTIANIFYAAFFAIYAYLMYSFITRVKTDKRAIFTTSSLIILVLFFTNPTSFQPWYLLWIIPFILLSRIKSFFLLTFVLSYFLIMNFWKRMSVLAVPMMALYFVMLAIYNRYEKRLKFLFSLEEQ